MMYLTIIVVADNHGLIERQERGVEMCGILMRELFDGA